MSAFRFAGCRHRLEAEQLDGVHDGDRRRCQACGEWRTVREVESAPVSAPKAHGRWSHYESDPWLAPGEGTRPTVPTGTPIEETTAEADDEAAAEAAAEAAIMRYIRARYGSARRAVEQWHGFNWYRQGSVVTAEQAQAEAARQLDRHRPQPPLPPIPTPE